MVFTEDVLRGVRRGAILLAALLIGVATYRILRATFSARPISGAMAPRRVEMPARDRPSPNQGQYIA